MAYQVIRDPNGVPNLILSGEPAYCHVLTDNGAVLEAEMDAGQWLLMAFAVWSAPDVAAVQVALDFARNLDGKLNLGLRPYDDPDELSDRWAAIAPDANGPFWILLRDGTVSQSRNGIFTAEELSDALSL